MRPVMSLRELLLSRALNTVWCYGTIFRVLSSIRPLHAKGRYALSCLRYGMVVADLAERRAN
jgi:hypothetical protein